MDSLMRGLTVVAGSAEEAKVQLARLKEIAKLPGLGLQEAIQGSINLQSAGMSAQLAEASLRGFGNALATVGKGKAELEGVGMALSQIMAKGKVSAEEINQIAERVPQIRKVMESAFGTANTELLQKQGISSEVFITKIVTELNKLPPVTSGAQNAWENMTDAIQAAAVSMWPKIEPIFTKLTDLVSRVAVAFSELSGPTQTAILVLGLVAIAAGPLINVMGQIPAACLAAGTAIRGVGKALTWLLAHPIVLAIAGIVLLVAALYKWHKAMKDMQPGSEAMVKSSIKASEAQKQQAEKAQALVKQYDALKAKTNKTSLEQAQMNLLFQQIRALAPDVVTGVDLIGGAYDKLTGKIKALTEQARQGNIQLLKLKLSEANEKLYKKNENIKGLESFRPGPAGEFAFQTKGRDSSLKQARIDSAQLSVDIANMKAELAALEGGPIAAAAQKAAGDAQSARDDAAAADEVLYEVRHRNATEIKALEMERDKALEKAEGPKLRAAIEKDYADRIHAVKMEQADQEKAKEKELAEFKARVMESEQQAYEANLASKLAMQGKAFDAERMEAVTTYNQEIRSLMALAATGEEVWQRLLLARQKLAADTKRIDEEEKADLISKADAARALQNTQRDAAMAVVVLRKRINGNEYGAQRQEAKNEWATADQDLSDKALEIGEEKVAKEREQIWLTYQLKMKSIKDGEVAAEKQRADTIARIYEDLSLRIIRLKDGEVAANLRKLDYEREAQVRSLAETLKDKEALAWAIQAVDADTAAQKQSLIDAETKKQMDAMQQVRDMQKSKIGFMRIEDLGRNLMVAGAKMAFGQPTMSGRQDEYGRKQVDAMRSVDFKLGTIKEILQGTKLSIDRGLNSESY